MSRLNDQQKIDMVNEYTSKIISCAELSRKYGVSLNSIIRLLRRRQIRIKGLEEVKRKYYFDEQYFKEINNERKAYFLGLFYADGCNHEKRHYVTIGLQRQDSYILEEFNKDLNFKKPISVIKKENRQDMCRISIYSNIMSEHLKILGCMQAKTFILKFPTEEQVPKYLLRHFIRGMLDGDGCICAYLKDRRISASIVSTVYFCERLKEILSELGIYSSVYLPNKDKINTTRKISISSINGCHQFLDWIYQDATIFFQRKYEKYLLTKEVVRDIGHIAK